MSIRLVHQEVMKLFFHYWQQMASMIGSFSWVQCRTILCVCRNIMNDCFMFCFIAGCCTVQQKSFLFFFSGIKVQCKFCRPKYFSLSCLLLLVRFAVLRMNTPDDFDMLLDGLCVVYRYDQDQSGSCDACYFCHKTTPPYSHPCVKKGQDHYSFSLRPMSRLPWHVIFRNWDIFILFVHYLTCLSEARYFNKCTRMVLVC